MAEPAQADESTPLIPDPSTSTSTSTHTGAAPPTRPQIRHASYYKTQGPGAHTTHPDYDGDLGERLPYNDYTTIDWLHDLVKDSARHRRIHQQHATIRTRVAAWWDAAQGWVAACLIGLLTACVAWAVDVAVAAAAGWKEGYCSPKIWLDRAACCAPDSEACDAWQPWTEGESSLAGYAVYVAVAVVFGLIAGGVTMTTRTNLPAVTADENDADGKGKDQYTETVVGKQMYMAAGSGIPEIKTILSGFVIPHFLDVKVLAVKATGATFAVATGMCLGKEGPFVHISACVGHLVANWFPKYRDNERKMREILSVACSAGLSVAFGAPIGGVLFSYEEISTYFPRRIMWKSFLCSLVAAATLKQLNPTGTGKLVLFETNYGVDYDVVHYLVFIFLGVCGGVFGGLFCQANFMWSKFFRAFPLIKRNPVLELSLVVLLTAVLQYPNRLIRDTGDIVMADLLVDCRQPERSWLCQQEAKPDGKGIYYAWLISGTLVKLLLTIVTFGCKVPSGIIIPSLDAGALFGRMVGQLVPNISPGVFAMVGAAAFLAGVSRMTVSLAVIMFELTGEVNFTPPFMVAILTSKWVADAISADGVYDLSQHLLGHPFLDAEHALAKVRGLRPGSEHKGTAEDLIPPGNTMEDITLYTGPDYRVRKSTLRDKLAKLKARGLMDAGLVLVNERCICHGYLPEAELEFALQVLDKAGEDEEAHEEVDLLEGVISEFIDRSPLTIMANAPVEYVVEMFGKLGLRYLIIVEEETARVAGAVIKKRLVSYLDALH
ncbi:chloride channel [Podospora didyma]|uniref:Chloride channel protein n=1 Tax=Podospora didyma TaxID=330526 RepID=A0AAE0N3X7_9PEZI|nr:chloride channel [Podospora didyma]